MPRGGYGYVYDVYDEGDHEGEHEHFGFKDIGKGIKDAGKGIGSGVVNAGKDVGGAVKDVGQTVGSGVVSVGKGIGNTAVNVGKGIANVAKSVGTAIFSFMKSIWKFLGKLAWVLCALCVSSILSYVNSFLSFF